MEVIGKENLKSTPQTRFADRLKAERLGDFQIALKSKPALLVYLGLAVVGVWWIHQIFPN